MAPVSGPLSVGEPIEKLPIFELSGQPAGPSESKFAWASLQALWPSAASGLIVKPGGRVTIADLISEGVVAKPSNWGVLSSRFKPEGASVSRVVALASRTGLKVSC